MARLTPRNVVFQTIDFSLGEGTATIHIQRKAPPAVLSDGSWVRLIAGWLTEASIPLFTRERPADDGWLFRDDRQVSPCGRVGLTPALFPFLQCAFADAISP